MTQNIDIALEQDDFGKFDISFGDDGDFDLTKGFNTAIDMSIFCERRASSAEVPVASRRRGWWGNVGAVVDGFEIGSKVWLVKQERLTPETINKTKDYITRGLAWFIDDGWAVDTGAEVVFVDGKARLDVVIVRPNGQVEKRGYDFWQNTKVN